MGEPFDVTTDEQDGTTLVPNFATSGPQPPDIGLLPDLTQALGPRPSLPMPQPLPPPPSPTQDPRQQLLAIAALSMAAGMGPQAGGAGAFRGFMQGQQVLQADQSAKYRLQLAQQAQQQQIALEQARSDQRLFDQRAQNIERAIINFKTASEKLGSKKEYDALADAYGAALQQYGVRNIDGNWLRTNVPYMKPSEAKTAQKAFADLMKNPVNAERLKTNPELAATSIVRVDLNGDGIIEELPLSVVADKAGMGFATVNGQIIPVPRQVAGSSEFSVKVNAKLAKFRAENRREPNEQEFDAIVQEAGKPEKAPPTPHFNVQQTYDTDGKPSGLVKVNTLDGTVTPVQSDKNLRPPPVGLATEQRATKGALSTLDQLDKAIDDAADLLGPGRGRYANFEQMVGSADPRIQALGVKMKAAKMQVDHAVTGSVRAGASPMLIKQWDNILANNITPQGLKAGVQAMREILNGGKTSTSRFTIVEQKER